MMTSVTLGFILEAVGAKREGKVVRRQDARDVAEDRIRDAGIGFIRLKLDPRDDERAGRRKVMASAARPSRPSFEHRTSC